MNPPSLVLPPSGSRPPRRRPHYEPDFKERALLKLASGLSPRRVAQLMDVPMATLMRWRQQALEQPPTLHLCSPRPSKGLRVIAPWLKEPPASHQPL